MSERDKANVVAFKKNSLISPAIVFITLKGYQIATRFVADVPVAQTFDTTIGR